LTGSRLFLDPRLPPLTSSWTTISTDSNVGAAPRRQKQPSEEIAIKPEERDRTGNLIPQRFTPLLEAGVALAGEVLALLVIVPERLHCTSIMLSHHRKTT